MVMSMKKVALNYLNLNVFLEIIDDFFRKGTIGLVISKCTAPEGVAEGKQQVQ